MSDPARFDATISPPPWRGVALVLDVVAAGALLWCLVRGVLLTTEDVPLWVLVRAVVLLAGAPASAAWLVRRAHRGVVVVDGDTMRLQVPGRALEVPLAAVAAVAPARCALLDGALSLTLRSGTRLPVRIVLADPTAWLDRLAAAVPPADLLRDALAIRLMYEAASRPPRWWDRPIWKFVGFALIPTLPLFRVDQLIAYGAWRGEYLQFGLAPYLAHFALYWATVTIYLIMFATVIRVPAELIVVAATAAAPARGASVRRLAEVACRALYYGGVPVLVLLRFLPW